jgi:hypothetical protein
VSDAGCHLGFMSTMDTSIVEWAIVRLVRGRSTAGPAFSAQRVNRRGGDDPFDAADDPFDAARQFRVQGYERVCLQLSERNIFGVVGRGPSQLIRQGPF